jgi:putative hydrolase of HD superfamily
LLVQARMHTTPEKLSYNLTPYCQKCLELLREYQKRPRSVISEKLLYYFQSVSDDLESYVNDSRFDAAFSLYGKLSEMRKTKRAQWLKYGIQDPESVAEHTFSAWMLAMIYLPNEYNEQHYDKQEILDMLLVHDMAEAVLGDTADSLAEPTKELKRHNAVLRKFFLKGTYPEVANMNRYYDVWTRYFMGQNINARVARDINLIQTVNTFFAYFLENPKQPLEMVKGWLSEGEKLSTDLGYELFNRIIVRNPYYRKAVDGLITAKGKQSE